MKKRLFLASAILVGLLITGMLVAAATWPVLNVVETGQTPEYPEVQPLYYSADPRRVFDESEASVEALERFELVEADAATRTLRAEATTRVFGFVDDVTVRVEPVTEFVTRVHVRSASRVGKGDFGQNARNIRTFLDELDARLGAVRFDPRAPADEPPSPPRPPSQTSPSEPAGASPPEDKGEVVKDPSTDEGS